MGNCYIALNEIKSRLGVTVTSDDALLLSLIEASSRTIDNLCHRHFFIEAGAKYFNGTWKNYLEVPDLMSVSSFAVDTERDLTFDGETWDEDDDFYLSGAAGIMEWPKCRIHLTPLSNKRFTHGDNLYEVTGQWGYGNGTSEPWYGLAQTGTVDSSALTLAISSATAYIQTGHTISVENEHMYVTDYSGSGTNVTVDRGVNGSTAAAHSAKKVSVMRYPSDLSRLALYMAIEAYKIEPMAGMLSESIGNYSYSRVSAITDTMSKTIDRVLRPYMLSAVA